MSATWDPANLFQISYEIDNEYALISCIGEVRGSLGSSRCKNPIPERLYPKIRSLISELSKTEPENALETELLHLARLCLCQEYHQHQVTDIAKRWSLVAQMAGEHQQRLIEDVLEKIDTQDTQTHLALRNAQDELRKHQIKHTTSLLENYQQRKDLEQKQLELSAASHSLEDLKQNNASLQMENEELCKKKIYLTKHNDVLSKQLETATKRAQGLDAKLSYSDMLSKSSKAQLDGLREERVSLKEQVERLRSERDVARNNYQQAATERTEADQSLQLALAELAQQRELNASLARRVEYLTIAERMLKDNIAACWLHDICAWVMRYLGFSHPKSDETEKGHLLV